MEDKKNTQTSKTTTVALPERGDTFHSLKMVRKRKKKINKSGKNKQVKLLL